MPFVITWCTGCHSSALAGDLNRQGAPSELNFETLDMVRANLALMYIDAADDNNAMPPAGGPTDEERLLLGEWLACGAP